ncbi:Sulfate/thiosulfate import ATP-binding protein CysA [Thiorhodovibrio winogradskyi]|uniref:Sulfate/thiosulfate import ATP-binding protein CysA n=1 Tax=Thiorhodovibrio winogradskyi TaxID=77007 RepID=A0ABZ0SEY8_9GAMM|nr:molybdenum ABC transporter ATP-binding protein [Thiorhodovibrio winogradskyi]
MSQTKIQARFHLDYPDFSLDVDLDLPGRGVTALFGHSGSGKTTLLRLIAGLNRVREGYLQVNGAVWQDGRQFLPTHRRPLGYVFQEASLFPHLSARANLAYGMKRAGAAAMGQEALDQAVALLGIGHLLERRPPQLSGGERQRIAIARALAVQPRLLLMDEPLAALDLKRKQEILPYLERLHDTLEIPVLYVTHSPDEVARLADTVVLLEQGRVRASGRVSEVFSRLDLPIAQDQDASAIIQGRVLSHDDRYALTRLEIPGGHLTVARLERKIHDQVRVRVHARDVSLALDEPGTSSIVNILPAHILELREIEQAQVLVKLCTGAGEQTPLLARITRHSRDRLRLHQGQPVFAQVKAVALMD